MDARAKKISETMRAKGLDNFRGWRDEQKRLGNIKSEYPPFTQDGDLAEFIGAVLGDGNITQFPRCECLRITGDVQKPEFVYHYAALTEKLFNKKPTVAKVKSSNAMTITLYEKHISSRLGIPAGSRTDFAYVLPDWIAESHEYIIRFLRGLYEAEGTLAFHKGTYTHKFQFSNANEHLLQLVMKLVQELGFHPHYSYRKIQVSKKDEVQKLADLLQFRHYNS